MNLAGLNPTTTERLALRLVHEDDRTELLAVNGDATVLLGLGDADLVDLAHPMATLPAAP